VDQIAYDSATNRYVLPARHYQTSKIAAASNFVPTLGLVDAASRSIITTLAIGNNAHSVAVDSATGQAYLPFGPGVAAFPNGGIQVVTIH
jgi:DNA-binding beta-propeller fold protein YncE